MPSVYFTSDTHYGHKNIIDYCRRPFADLDAMHEAMIARWNARVGSEDTVYHLGDFGFGSIERLHAYRTRLNGKIVLVMGNHDRSAQAMKRAGMDEVLKRAYLNELLPGRTVFLRHHPKYDWGEEGIHLCGHVHEAWKRKGSIINVGVDVRDFEPKTLAELLEAGDA